MNWTPAETPPAESGDYLCLMRDWRDGYNDEWFEVVTFRVFHGNPKGRWETGDVVMEWTPIVHPGKGR